MSLLRTIRTVRYLRREQIVGQIHNRLRRHWENPAGFAKRHAPPFPGCAWTENTTFLAPGAQANSSDRLREGRFSFVGVERSLGWPPADWTVSKAPRLWQYNVHYFEWLWSLTYPDAKMVLLDWVGRHPLEHGHVGWEPYPISLRLMNWCAVCFGRFQRQVLADRAFLESLWPSIVLQADWLEKHLEYHLLGNHLLENGAALAFAGTCFEGEAAQRWKATGLAILEREIPEQILPDGMHFERSPMYHVRMVYLFHLLLETRDTAIGALVREPLERMERALSRVCHPDGEISLFNDSALGIYNAPNQLLGAFPTACGPWDLPDAGYYGWRDPEGNFIAFDAGPIGPDYIPGHAHGDMFSFEVSLRGQRVIVDSGVHDYVPGAMRDYCRSTRAHNTVEIDEKDQSEFWGAFRVARRARPREVQWKPCSTGFTLDGWHDGYHRLAGRPTHHRAVTWNATVGLQVQDRIRAGQPVRVASRVHLHPRCHVQLRDSHEALVEYDAGSFLLTFTGPGRLIQEDSFYCPEFGIKESNLALAFMMEGKEVEATYNVLPK